MKHSRYLKPVNTDRSTKWALKVFKLWCKERNQRFPEDAVPGDFFATTDPSVINKHLSRFAVETRKTDGSKYRPATIHQLLCGVLRHMREVNPGCINFLNKKDPCFKQLQGTLDVLFHQLHSEGLGTKIKSADVFTQEDEQKLWNSGVLSLDTPKSLQNAAFFTVGKMFCLCGGVEHRALKLSQLKRMDNPDRYIYYENVSKNHNGSFKQLHVKSKVVPLFACPEAGDRCTVRILDSYISKLPQDAITQDLFYVRPLEIVPTNPSSPWYSSVAVGKNTLNQKAKIMCSLAEIAGMKTNHSLRATGATHSCIININTTPSHSTANITHQSVH